MRDAGSRVVPSGHQADEILVAFAGAVRAAGIGVTMDRTRAFLDAASLLGVDDRELTYLAGRATLCGGPSDLDRYEQVFAIWFGGEEPLPASVVTERDPVRSMPLDDSGAGGTGKPAEETMNVAASDTEVLRQRDVATMTPAEKALLARMFDALDPRPPRRPAHRRTPWRRGDVDPQRTLRRMLRQFGEPGRVEWRRSGTRPRRVVLLIDVSGSMSGYADALLRLAHRFANAPGRRTPVEVFSVGTRLTQLTRAMRHRDAERAMIAAGRTVPDWSGGTRLGETLKLFLDRWGQRGMARGAVVVVFSDGWERGDCAELAEQMARLHRLAHRVIWVNPHRGREGYQPVQQGIKAVLGHVDHFVAGHSLAAYAELTEVVADA
ncbi:MAG: vWA domain-containing protein [Nocardioides sp.]